MSASVPQHDFEVRRDDLGATRLLESAPHHPGRGEVAFAVERFGFSANNITYALLGDRLGYWALFPGSDGWARIPVWGYLRVTASGVPGIEEGRRAFGFCPMSTSVVLQPARVTDAGFVDAATHRSPLSAVYNAYAWLDREPVGGPELEDRLLVLRPLFWLSFLVDDHLAEPAVSNPKPVLLTSASSKAAIGIAYLLSRRGVSVQGLTSPSNLEFVEQLGVYDQVHAYSDLDGLALAPGILVDVAGNAALRARIALRFGGRPVHQLVVGATHQDAAEVGEGSGASRQTFFFAPDHIRARARSWGWEALNARYTGALHGFAEHAAGWLHVIPAPGVTAVERVYRRVLENRAAPTEAHVLALCTPAN